MAESSVSAEQLKLQPNTAGSQQTPVNAAGGRIGNVIYKTTSETLRISDSSLQQVHNLPVPQQQLPQTSELHKLAPTNCVLADAKKTSSFQITSVTVSSSVSNDGEDDSCGEVEDCQTDTSEAGSQRRVKYEMYLDADVMYDADSGLSVTSIGMPVSIAQAHSESGGLSLKPDDKDHGWQV